MPRILTSKVHRLGHWLFYAGDLDVADVPPELHLREFRDTPAGDLDALAELCSLGLIRTFDTTEPYRDLPLSTSGQWTRMLTDIWRLLPTDAYWGGDETERNKVSAPGLSGFPVHAAEVAIRVRHVQRATDHLIAYRNGDPVQRAWRDCENEYEAWRRFRDCIGAALRDFHVRVEIPAMQEPQEEFTIGGVYTTLYSIAMLQLVNDLAEEIPYLRCANETCRRLFVRQRGRTKYGGNRMRGVMYCSSTCARAQYQREKRRRDRAARKTG